MLFLSVLVVKGASCKKKEFGAFGWRTTRLATRVRQFLGIGKTQERYSLMCWE